jgi:hypothetical protein
MISFPCPSCQRPLQVADELAGQPFQCPVCASAVTVPSVGGGVAEMITPAPASPWPAPPPSAATAITDQPPIETTVPRWPGDADLTLRSSIDTAGWRSVCTGLRLFQISVVIKIGVLATYLVVLAPMIQSGSSQDLRDIHALATVAVVAGAVLELAGGIFLVQVPERSGFKPYAAAL